MKKVYDNIAFCCGCGVCSIACPKNAILMEQDNVGFIYHVINQKKCVDCRMCKNVCAFEERLRCKKKNEKKVSFAAVNKDKHQLNQSTSGGIFSGIASEFIKNGGAACGANMELKNKIASVEHILINSEDKLTKLQGSKYVQSNMWKCICDLQEILKSGKKVLFSGTPCQVDSIKSLFKSYVGYQLFTIDIICHGVPNQKFFNGYLEEFQNENDIELIKFDFRNKKYGWGLDGLAIGNKGSEIRITTETSSYYKYFIDGEIYRESCYQCPYACLDRVGDITIGDYWGIEIYNPELMDINGGKFSKKDGVSCLIINTDIGSRLIEKYGTKIYKEPVDINNILIINTQLKEPAKNSGKRVKILSAYKVNGYKAVKDIFQKQLRNEKIKRNIKKLIPKSIKNIIKEITLFIIT